MRSSVLVVVCLCRRKALPVFDQMDWLRFGWENPNTASLLSGQFLVGSDTWRAPTMPYLNPYNYVLAKVDDLSVSLDHPILFRHVSLGELNMGHFH